jgi:hypothetical protein
MRKAIALLAACGLLLLASAASAQDAPAWPGRLGAYVFEVTRDGKPIGTQTVTVKQDGDKVTVTTESQIAVKMLGVTVYRMHQVLTETYRGGRLVEVAAETKDPDGFRKGEIRRDRDNQWSGQIAKEQVKFDCDCETTTLWQLTSLKAPTIIEASQLRTRAISIEDKGTEMLDLPEGKVQARRFAVKGEIEREVWYDSAGNLVAAQQFGSDGSDIRQYLLSDPQATRPTGDEAEAP